MRFLTLALSCAALAACDAPAPQAQATAPPALAVLDYKLEAHIDGAWVAGHARNQSGRVLACATVRFNAYGADGTLEGNAEAMVADLQPGDTWAFRADLPESRYEPRLQLVMAGEC